MDDRDGDGGGGYQWWMVVIYVGGYGGDGVWRWRLVVDGGS